MAAERTWAQLCRVYPRVPRNFKVTSPRRSTKRAHERPIIALAFSPDDESIAVSGGGLIPGEVDIRVYATRTKQLQHVCTYHSMGVFDLAFDPATGALASVSHDYSVVLWNLAERDAIFVTGEEDAVVSRSCVRIQGHWLIVGGGMAWHGVSPELARFNLLTGEQQTLRTCPTGLGCSRLALHPEAGFSVLLGEWMSFGGPPDELWTFSADGELVAKVSFPFEAHQLAGCAAGRVALIANPTDHVHELRVLSPSGQTLASQHLGTESGCLAASKDGSRLAVSHESTLRVVDSESLETLWEVELERDGRICSVAWSANRQWVAVGSYEGALRVFDAQSGRSVFQ